MHIVFLTYPDFTKHWSIERFTQMLADGMQDRGHQVEIWKPKPVFVRLAVSSSSRKWLGYIDQYIVFPLQVKQILIEYSQETLFVLTDHSLGIWVPIVKNRRHMIHCHDFLAQMSADGEFIGRKTGWTGRQYQRLIRQGLAKGQYFTSVSGHTEQQLRKYISPLPSVSKTVYNGINPQFAPYPKCLARLILGDKIGVDLVKGYLLHVGGNQWYKNRRGVLEIYEAWRSTGSRNLPLLLVGENPTRELLTTQVSSKYKDDIYWLKDIEDSDLHLAYAGASVLIFPSLAEGFGWPIAEAMASGCLVITTAEAPMTEVAGDAGFFIRKRPAAKGVDEWSNDAARVVEQVLGLESEAKRLAINKGFTNARRFSLNHFLDQIEGAYSEALGASNKFSNTLNYEDHAELHCK